MLSMTGLEYSVVTGVTCGEVTCFTAASSGSNAPGGEFSGVSLLLDVTAAGVSCDIIKLVDGS